MSRFSKDHSKDLVQEFVDNINELNEVMECHYVTGNADFILKVITQDIESYNQFIIEKLFRVANIGKVESLISMAVSKKTHVIDLERGINTNQLSMPFFYSILEFQNTVLLQVPIYEAVFFIHPCHYQPFTD